MKDHVEGFGLVVGQRFIHAVCYLLQLLRYVGMVLKLTVPLAALVEHCVYIGSFTHFRFPPLFSMSPPNT